jgi:hypothetical protein
VSVFFPIMARLVRLFGDIEAVYFVVYLLFHWLTLAALAALAVHFTRRLAPAIVVAFLYLGQAASLGGAVSYFPRLTHSHPAVALLLWAIYLHLRGHRTAALVLCGLTFNLHALYASYVAFLLLVDSALEWLAHREPLPLAPALAFLLLALPALVLLCARFEPIPAVDLPLWLATMRERSSPHTFPLSAPGVVYARYLLFLALAGFALSRADARLRRFGLHVGAGVLILCSAGLVGSEWLPAPFLIKLQLLRSSKWLSLVLLAPIAAFIVEAWQAGRLARLAASLAFLGIVMQEPVWAAGALLILALSWPGRWPVAALLLALFALFISASTNATPWPDRLGLAELGVVGQRLTSDPLLMACVLLFVLHRVAVASALPQRVALGSAAVLLGAALYVAPGILRGARDAERAEPWNDAQLWVRAHVPSDVVVLTPPYLEGFRVFSERAIVGEWKDGTQQFFSWSFTKGWLDRMQLLKGETRAFDRLSAPRLLQLSRALGATCLVFPSSRELPLPKLYANSQFAVYQLRELEPVAPAP